MKGKFEQIRRQWELENQKLEYSDKVKEYMERNRNEFLDKWAEACENTDGRISYDELEIILGKNYPKAKWIPENDNKSQIITFFKELDIFYRADENHMYFP